MIKRFSGIIFVLLIYLVIAFYRLDALPGEWYGDITLLNTQVSDALSGRLSLGYICGSGPLYPWYASLFVRFFGVSYLTYKIASVIAGAITIVFTYVVAAMLLGRMVATIAAFILTTSFWFLVWARLGSTPVMATPILALVSTLFLVVHERTDKKAWLVSGGAVSMLGLFTYPGAYFFPIAYLMSLFLLRWKRGVKIFVREIAIAVLAMMPFAVLFSQTVMSQSGTFLEPGGYVGHKLLPVFSSEPGAMVVQFAVNIWKTWGSYLGAGDTIFRVNVPHSPHLDSISGILFFAGIGLLMVVRKLRPSVPYLIVPVVLFPVPSMMPTLPVAEIPSMTRTYAVLPYVAILAAITASFVWGKAKKYVGMYMAHATTILLMCVIAVVNLHKYFVVYPTTLPNRNSPFARIIASYIDTLSPLAPVYMTDCCWGERGQPEVQGVYYSLRNQQGRNAILHHENYRQCHAISPFRGATIILNPNRRDQIERFSDCFPTATGRLHTDSLGQEVFYSLTVPEDASYGIGK